MAWWSPTSTAERCVGTGSGAMWRQSTARAGLPQFRYHDLRHHFASALIAGGCSVKVVQKALGHASARETLDVYGHLCPTRRT